MVFQLVLTWSFIIRLAMLQRQLEPILENAKKLLGGDGVPRMSIGQAISLGIYKLVESADFSKISGQIFGGSKPK